MIRVHAAQEATAFLLVPTLHPLKEKVQSGYHKCDDGNK